MAGHRRAEATPSFRRLCPAMTANNYPAATLASAGMVASNACSVARVD